MSLQEQIHVQEAEKDVELEKILEKLPAQNTLIDDIWKFLLKLKRVIFGY